MWPAETAAVRTGDLDWTSGGHAISGEDVRGGAENDHDVLSARRARRDGHVGGQLPHDLETATADGIDVGPPFLRKSGVLVMHHSDQSARDSLDQAASTDGGRAVRLSGMPHRVGQELRHHQAQVRGQLLETPHLHALHQQAPGVVNRVLCQVKVQIHLTRPSVKAAPRLFEAGVIEGSRSHVWSSSVDQKPRHGAPVAVCTGCAPVSNH